jgi:hypothetical protein
MWLTPVIRMARRRPGGTSPGQSLALGRVVAGGTLVTDAASSQKVGRDFTEEQKAVVKARRSTA